MTKSYWNDDTQVLSLGGCPGHSEGDIVAGELVPEWYQKEYEERFDNFCQNQQISSKRNVTFSEKQQAKLVNAQSTEVKLRTRIKEQTEKIKGLEKQVENFEVSISQIEVLEGHKEELEQLKAENKSLGESFAALKNEKAAAGSGDEVKKLGDEKPELELEIEQLMAEKQYLEECFAALEEEKTSLDVEVDNLRDEKEMWEKTKGSKKELEKLLKGIK